MIELTRFGNFKDRTIGRWVYGDLQLWTVERPWLDNAPNVSCIPDGEYVLTRYDSGRFGNRTWEVHNVPGRTYIAIHPANYADQLEGCIALGWALMSELGGVASSRTACKAFYEATKEFEELPIRIKRGYLN